MPARKKMSDKVDKRYRAKITVPGVNKSIYISAKTKRELEEKRADVHRRYIEGIQDNDITFHALVDEWWELDKLPRIRSESTMLVYRSIVTNYIKPFFPPQQLARAVTYQQLQACVDQAEGMAASLGTHLRSLVMAVWQYAVSCKYVATDIASNLKRPTGTEPAEKSFLTDDQTQRLLRAAETEQYGDMILLLYYLGLRRGEMLALRWGDIDWAAGMVHVQRSVVCNCKIADGKTRASNRRVPVPAPLRMALYHRRGLPNQYIIQNPESEYDGHLVTSSAMLWIWHKMMYHAGLGHLTEDFIQRNNARIAAGKPPLAVNEPRQITVDITPHWLRHNYVSILYDAGIDPVTATRIVGHANYQTTADIYTHITEMRQRQAAVNIDHVFSKVAERLPFAR